MAFFLILFGSWVVGAGAGGAMVILAIMLAWRRVFLKLDIMCVADVADVVADGEIYDLPVRLIWAEFETITKSLSGNHCQDSGSYRYIRRNHVPVGTSLLLLL
jgi:hypothetical protein